MGVAVMVVVVVVEEAVLDDARKVLPAPPRPQRMKLVEEGEGSVRKYFDILNGWQEGVPLLFSGSVLIFLINSGVNRSRARLMSRPSGGVNDQASILLRSCEERVDF